MIEVLPLTGAAELGRAAELYREVFGRTMNRRILVALAAHSGHVLGAYEDDGLVGYGLSFLARSEGRLYHYSQTVAVLPAAQGRGVGRRIKQAQRAVALADGIDLMRWSFDPMHARNAHFNTDVLGARIRGLHENFYGEGTDRLLVDWELRDPPAPVEWDVSSVEPGSTKELAEGVAIGVPAAEPDDALRRPVRAALTDALSRGLVGVSCRRADERTAVYLFAAR